MGNTTTAASAPSAPDFTRERCKQCGICAHFCPKGAIELDADKNPQLVHPEACTGCMLCEYLCPDFGVKVHPNGRSAATVPPAADEGPDSPDQKP